MIRALVQRRMKGMYAKAVADYRALLRDAMPVNSDLHLLDVGCDDGDWTAQLAEQMTIPASQVSGIEILEHRRELAVRRGFDVRTGDIEQRWPFSDGSADVVHANQVIEHVKRLDHFTSETWRVLRPGGSVIVFTENLASWPNVVALSLGYMPFSLTNISSKGAIGNPFALHQEWDSIGESWQHIHVLTLRALREILEYKGFVVEHVFGAGYFPFSGTLSRTLSALSPKRAHFIGLVARRPNNAD